MEESKIDLPQLVPLLSGLIILMGVTNSYFYYAYFGVDILHYMDFSELFISFLESPIMLFLGAVGGMFYSITTYDFIYSKLEIKSNRYKDISDQLSSNIGSWKKLWLHLELQIPYVYLGFGYAMFLVIEGLVTGDFEKSELILGGRFCLALRYSHCLLTSFNSAQFTGDLMSILET